MKQIMTVQLGLREVLLRLFREEEGQDMVEYVLLASLIALACIALIILVGPELKNSFQAIVNQLHNTS